MSKPLSRCAVSTLLAAVLPAFLCSGVVRAEDSSSDKSQYSLFNPTPDSALRSLQSDRPLRAFTPYTVDAGRVQVSSDFFFYTRSSSGSTTTDNIQALDPEIRVGLTQFLEFDVQTSGLLTERTTSDRTGRTLSGDTGTGNVTLRARYNLFGDDGGDYAFSLIPLLNVPTGDRHFSNKRVEGGLAAPLALSLPYDFSLILQSEVLALHDSTGAAYASFMDLAYLKHGIPGVKNLSGVVEFVATNNADRHTADTYTFDTALAYLVDDNTQLDIASLVGLNRAAPTLQINAGIAHRF